MRSVTILKEQNESFLFFLTKFAFYKQDTNIFKHLFDAKQLEKCSWFKFILFYEPEHCKG